MNYNTPVPVGTLQSLPPTQCETQIERLKAVTEENHKLATELNVRLKSILREEPPPAIVKDVPEEFLVSHAQVIRTIHESAFSTNQMLKGIMERIEL